MIQPSLFAVTSTISAFLRVWLDNRMLEEPEQVLLESYYSRFSQSSSDRMWSFYDSQTSELMELIRTGGSPDVLEVGCGCGTESLWMAMHGAKVHAIDIKADRLRVADCRRRILAAKLGADLACRFERVSMLELDGDLSYEIIWIEQAFHHLEPREEVLDKLFSLLAPGGYVVISEANALNPLLQVQLLAKRGFKTLKTYTDDEGQLHPYGNERVVSALVLRTMLERRGMQTLSLRHFRIFPHHHWFDSVVWVERIAPKWFYPIFTHYNYVGQKKTCSASAATT